MFYKIILEREDHLSYGVLKQNILTRTLVLLTGETKSTIRIKRKFTKKELLKKFNSYEEAVDGYRTLHIL